jgi:hypothetical protein
MARVIKSLYDSFRVGDIVTTVGDGGIKANGDCFGVNGDDGTMAPEFNINGLTAIESRGFFRFPPAWCC